MEYVLVVEVLVQRQKDILLTNLINIQQQELIWTNIKVPRVDWGNFVHFSGCEVTIYSYTCWIISKDYFLETMTSWLNNKWEGREVGKWWLEKYYSRLLSSFADGGIKNLEPCFPSKFEMNGSETGMKK